MAKKNVNDPLKKEKLDLNETLTALDLKDFNYYNSLDEQQKKLYTPFVLLRFLSSATDQGGLHEFHCLAVNDIVNVDFWSLSKYPDFQHMLMCLVGVGKKQYHKWIPMPKKGTANKVKELILKTYPNFNNTELKIFIRNHTIEDFEEFCRDNGLSDKEIEPLVENFKKLKEEC